MVEPVGVTSVTVGDKKVRLPSDVSRLTSVSRC